MTFLRSLRTFTAALVGSSPRATPYRIERAEATPVEARALALAIMGAGFLLVERRRELLVSRTRGAAFAVVRLPRSLVIGPAPLEVRASDRDLVLGLMTVLAPALGTLCLRTPELGDIVVAGPTGAASPDAARAFAAVRRPRVGLFSLGERWRNRLR
jgi:hypothetical protein